MEYCFKNVIDSITRERLRNRPTLVGFRRKFDGTYLAIFRSSDTGAREFTMDKQSADRAGSSPECEEARQALAEWPRNQS